MQIFNASTQQLEDVTWSADANNEIVATFADGHFLKFPADSTQEDIQRLVAEHEQANTGHEVITPERLAAEAAQRAANETLIAQLNGNPMPEDTQYNATSTPTN